MESFVNIGLKLTYKNNTVKLSADCPIKQDTLAPVYHSPLHSFVSHLASFTKLLISLPIGIWVFNPVSNQ